MTMNDATPDDPAGAGGELPRRLAAARSAGWALLHAIVLVTLAICGWHIILAGSQCTKLSRRIRECYELAGPGGTTKAEVALRGGILFPHIDARGVLVTVVVAAGGRQAPVMQFLKEGSPPVHPGHIAFPFLLASVLIATSSLSLLALRTRAIASRRFFWGVFTAIPVANLLVSLLFVRMDFF